MFRIFAPLIIAIWVVYILMRVAWEIVRIVLTRQVM
jgi:hypothetical protein